MTSPHLLLALQDAVPALVPADTAWILVATALVLLMTPALAFFYGGLVRSKNSLNTMMMSYVALGFIGILWALVAYSLSFSEGSPWLGGFSNAMLNGVDLAPKGTIPHLLFMAYQGTFAIITAALISGAIVERMRFWPYIIFISAWLLVVYAPVAHWVWGGGWLGTRGVLDFAGGTVVHINAGVSALVAAMVLGSRKDYGRQAILPHNVPFVLLGAGLLWFGWFGFNGGSALAANASAALAFTNTFLAPMATLVVWCILDTVRTGHVTAVGGATGIVVGLVAITPAAGFVSPLGALALGGIAAFPSYFIILYRARTRVDDSLDVFAGPRHRRPHRRAPHRRLRGEGVGRHRRPARRQPGPARQAGARRRRIVHLRRPHDVRHPQGARPGDDAPRRPEVGRTRARRDAAWRGGLQHRRGLDPRAAR